MAKREIKAGLTDQTIDVFILDSSSSVGAGLTGLAYNTASLTCYYRKGATGTPTALTLATQTVGGAHSDGGFVAVDGTNMPGVYRLDLSDTIVATAGMVTIYLQGAANMAPCVLELEVVSVDKFDAVRGGMTALPNANANANGGLPVLSSSGTTLGYTVSTITTYTGNTPQTGDSYAIVNSGTHGNSALKTLIDTLDDYVDTEIASIISTLSTISGYIDTEVAAIKAKTDNLPTDPADASDIAASFSSLASTLSTISTYIDTEVAAIKAKTDNLPSDPADASDIAASFSTVNSTLSTIAAYIDTEVAAIKAKTDNLPTDPADASDISSSFSTVNSTLATIAGYIDTEVASIVSTLSTIAGYIDTEVAAIKAKTDNLPSDPADASDISTAFAATDLLVTTVDTVVDAIRIVTDRLDTALELDGGVYRYTTNALEQAPSGGGGGGGSAGGCVLSAKISDLCLCGQEFVELIQGEGRVITFIVQAEGQFDAQVATEITCRIKDVEGNLVTKTAGAGDIERVCEELDVQVIRVTLDPADSLALVEGLAIIELAFDNQKARLSHSLKVLETIEE